MKRIFPLAFILLFLLSSCKNESKKPNFIFILVDDLGWSDLSVYGSSFYETPSIDRLAESGIRFTDAYAACPVCSPTRASIMTGKYPSRLNITDWIPGNDPKNRKLLGTKDKHQMDLEELTLAEALKLEGYSTFFAGKWHLGDSGYFPEDQGFDYNIGGHHRGSPPGGYYSPYKNPKMEDGPEGEYLSDRLTDESISFIKNNAGEPFLLYLSFYTVHTPIQANVDFINYFKDKKENLDPDNSPVLRDEHEGSTLTNQVNAPYASMLASMDNNVGRLVDYINEMDLAKNTYIIFTSDNGGLSTLNRNRVAPTSVLPLRGGKGWCYEGGIRVPLIIAGPGLDPARSSAPVISTDFYPTILELAGIDARKEQHLDGVSLLPALNNKPLEREAIFWHYPHYHGSSWTPGAAIRKGDWKLIEFYDYEKTELYNLSEDIGESVDLSDTHPDKASELKDLLEKMQKETGAILPTINPDYNKND